MESPKKVNNISIDFSFKNFLLNERERVIDREKGYNIMFKKYFHPKLTKSLSSVVA